MRGEWIEITSKRGTADFPQCLSPCGESGLKSLCELFLYQKHKSLPMRGEWIEIAETARESERT